MKTLQKSMIKRTNKDKKNDIEIIIEDNLDYLVRFAFYRLKNKQEAEDVVYEAILKFLELNVAKINKENLRVYLFKILYNLCIDKNKQPRIDYVLLNDIEIEDEEETTEDILPNNILHYLDEIPEKESEIIMMRVLDELTFVEISKILSLPQSTVKSRYKAGMDKLRLILKQNKEG